MAKETTVRDRKRPRRPVSATDTMHQQKVDEMIVANRRVKQKDIANAPDISKERVHYIITVHLGYRKVSARWVPRQLTVEMKAQRKTICTQLLERFTYDGERFQRSIITSGESWVHHYDPESKMQSMQYQHKNSPAPKKFKVVASARKVLLTIFWDMEVGARHNNKFREICVNSACTEGPTQTGSIGQSQRRCHPAR